MIQRNFLLNKKYLLIIFFVFFTNIKNIFPYFNITIISSSKKNLKKKDYFENYFKKKIFDLTKESKNIKYENNIDSSDIIIKLDFFFKSKKFYLNVYVYEKLSEIKFDTFNITADTGNKLLYKADKICFIIIDRLNNEYLDKIKKIRLKNKSKIKKNNFIKIGHGLFFKYLFSSKTFLYNPEVFSFSYYNYLISLALLFNNQSFSKDMFNLKVVLNNQYKIIRYSFIANSIIFSPGYFFSKINFFTLDTGFSFIFEINLNFELNINYLYNVNFILKDDLLKNFSYGNHSISTGIRIKY